MAHIEHGDPIIIPNIHEYTQQIVDGALVLTRIAPVINMDVEDLLELDLRHSKIVECLENGISKPYHKYGTLLRIIYEQLDGETVRATSLLKFVTKRKIDGKFRWYPKLKLSIKCVNTKKILREIINMSQIAGIKLDLKIKLASEEIVRFRN
jgi:hypothetical protein